MSKFVCVRIVQANAMDLAQFQFDYDMSFAAFFMNADGTIYGRYGSRSALPKDAHRDIALGGLAKALSGAVSLHKKYPANKADLAGKQPLPVEKKRPEEFPSLRSYKPNINYKHQVAKSCMHCHQIHDAEREYFRSQRKPIPDRLVYPYPMPAIIGLHFDPKNRATITQVTPGSVASQAGLRPGDEVIRINSQPILSTADVQWILHTGKDGETLNFQIKRSGKLSNISFPLPQGYRKASDISWRVSTWNLRRIIFGGMKLEAKPGTAKMHLDVIHVGQYGKHAVAKRAGMKKGDVITSIADIDEPLNESEVLTRLLNSTKPGAIIPVTVKRNGKEIQIKIKTQ